MLAHFPGDVGDDFMPVLKLYPELGIGEGFDDRALHFDAFFFRHKACPESENAECNQDRSWIQTKLLPLSVAYACVISKASKTGPVTIWVHFSLFAILISYRFL